MRQLITVITNQILQQIKPNEINMVRLESFDNPIVYKSVCELLQGNPKVTHFVAKLTLEKYNQFTEAENANWVPALMYLHKGANLAYDEDRPAAYAQRSYVDFERAITKWRNESPNMPANQTSLILLMGTEAAPDDAGSLRDTTFVISPREIIALLNANYSQWFADILVENSFDNDESRKAIHTFYRALFNSVNVNIFKLSEFVDSLQNMQFASCQELIGHICETLNTVWGIPSILSPKYVPKVNQLSKGKLTSAKIITSAIKFIERADDIPSASALKKLKEKFARYANDNDVDGTAPFPADTALFSSYDAFETCVIDFMCGKDLKENRARLLAVDYAILDQIIGTKLPAKTSEKAPVVTGAPMAAYSRIFLDIANRFHNDYHSYPTHFCVRVDRISLSDCIDVQKEEAFRNACNFLGGILTFFDSCNLVHDDSQVTFSYENDLDPFDFTNHKYVIDRVHSTGKWGDPCKIYFTVKASNDCSAHSYEFKWAFSPYAPWLNAFSYLGNVLFRQGDSYTLPTLVCCKNIQDYLRCESEDEFYAQLSQMDDEVLQQKHVREVHRYFSGDKVEAIFDKLCSDFKNFAVALTDHGMYSALNSLRILVKTYTDFMQYIHSNYSKFTDVQKEKILLLLNCFTIASHADVIERCDMGEVLFPAYHPVMLEKIDAQQLFLRDGFAELAASKMENNIRQEKITAKLERLVQLSSITQGADFVMKRSSINLTCRSMWEYYGVYFGSDTADDLISGNAFGSTIVTDDEDASAMLHATPVSGIVVRNVMDYIRTFPARVDGLNVAFIAPRNMQHIVAAIHSIAKQLENHDTPATINLRIVCLNSKKNSAAYLKKWLDSYFDDERSVAVNTFLRNITITDQSDTEALGKVLENCDLCFNYHILKAADVWFDRTGDEIIDKDQAKFPMTFTPDTISATHGMSRKVSISQFQFPASREQTQANFIIASPYSQEGVYRTFRTLELTDIQNHIIEISHNACKWVVCIDPAIDRKMLENTRSRIIGFTTGEGSYGELNVTVSARKDILVDIKRLLQKRIKEKFSNWDEDRLKKAAEYCVDELSQYMDGSRILKALNPYDYEIHSFLAYILTLQMLGLTKSNDRYAVRALISLDSYKHWFTEDDELSKDNKRPDFMLIEIPKTVHNLDPAQNLEIHIKIIECKMGFQNENHIAKAQTQLEKGLRIMSVNWDPHNLGIMHRYWLNQLYRAIIFSPLNLDNTSAEYVTIRNKIYGILSGKYQIEWSGDIFAFWLDSNSETPEEWKIESTLFDELSQVGITLNEMICHSCGQMYIQKMLLPPQERTSVFTHNEIVYPETGEEPDEGEQEETGPNIQNEVVPPAVIAAAEENGSDDSRAGDDNGNAQTEEEPRAAGDTSAQSSKPLLSDVRFLIGEDLRTKEKYYWEFGNKSLNNRHLLINGNSGCGKTYCIQTLLMEMVRAGISGVVFDYTSGFTPDKLDPLFLQELGEQVRQRVVYLDKIPVNPFARQIVKVGGTEGLEKDVSVATRIANVFATVYGFGGQQKSALYKAIKNGFQHHGDGMSFAYLEDELNDVNAKQAETVLSKIQPFLDLEPFAEDEAFSWGSIRDSDGIVYIMQLDGFDRPTQLLLTELLLWDIWNYCVQNGNEEHPFVIVLDEAQNLSHNAESPSAKFLTEGRKFGISAWYATQFMKPQLSDDEIQRLQQAGQKLYFCPPDDGVMTVAKNIDIDAQGAKEWAPKLKSLKKGECVTCGNMVRNGKWAKYEPKIVKVTSFQERLNQD